MLEGVVAVGNLDALAALTAGAPAERKASAPASTGEGDDEIKAMLAEVDLLEEIRRDTGEQGEDAGDRIDFHNCPVCHHQDDFRYYKSSNSWSCFGASNTSGYTGGTALEYRKAVHGDDDSSAVKWLREATGHVVKLQSSGKRKEVQDAGGKFFEGFLLPSWVHVEAGNPPMKAPVLIEGIVRLGHTMLLTGKGKGSKTWSGIELAIAVSTGGEWFGFRCAKGLILYIDPELDRRSLDNRFHDVAKTMGVDCDEVSRQVSRWSLKGVMTATGAVPTISMLAQDITARCTYGDFQLIIIDSASAFMEGDENSSMDVRRFFIHVNRIAEATGATVMCITHMGKGAKGDWDAIERSRGSSSWGDSPDAPLSLLEIFPPSGEVSDYLAPGERAFVLEDSGLREFAGIEPRHLIFSHPVHRVDVEGVTESWKPKSASSAGGRRTGADNSAKSAERAHRCEVALASAFIERGIGADGLKASEAAEIVCRFVGETVKTSTLKKYIEGSELFDVEQISAQRWKVVPRSHDDFEPAEEEAGD